MENGRLDEVFARAGALMQRKTPALVAIDGRCGSGKTYLAGLLRERFSCNVFHMDDFYLPLSCRAENWREQTGGNMDFDRFLAEVLLPAEAGRAVAYRPYDCRTGAFRPAEEMPPRPLVVVEGTYSCHPLLAEHYDLRIFLTCSQAEQALRLKAREGERFTMFETCWIPMEERYFSLCGVEKKSGLTVDTTGGLGF